MIGLKIIKGVNSNGYKNTSLDCCIDELNSSVNVAEVEGFITKEIADNLRQKYLK